MKNKKLKPSKTDTISKQLNLFDACDGKHDFGEVPNQKIPESTDLNLENKVVLTSPYHFEFDSRRCPKCGKVKLIKKKFVRHKITLDKTGDVVFFLREYYCKACHSYPKVKLKNIFKKVP